MSFKDPGFDTRLASATAAKKAALERFRAQPAPHDPAGLERPAGRAAIQAARQERAVEREAARAKADEAERIARSEREAREAAEAAARQARAEIEAAEEAERAAARE